MLGSQGPAPARGRKLLASKYLSDLTSEIYVVTLVGIRPQYTTCREFIRVVQGSIVIIRKQSAPRIKNIGIGV
jgi:hypothetical protein